MAIQTGSIGASQQSEEQPSEQGQGLGLPTQPTFNVPTQMNLIQSNNMCLITEDRHDELTSSVTTVNALFFTLAFGAFVPTVITLFALGDEMSARSLAIYAGTTVALFLASVFTALKWFGDVRSNKDDRDKKIKVAAWTVIGVPTAPGVTPPVSPSPMQGGQPTTPTTAAAT